MNSRFGEIGYLCRVQAGYPFRSRIEESIKGNALVIQPKDVCSSGDINTKELIRVDIPTLKQVHMLKQGNVLLVNRGRFNAAVFNGGSAEPVIAAHSLLVLEIKQDMVLPEYIAHYFNSMAGQAALRRLDQTSTVPFVSKSNLEAMEIPVPSLDRQRALSEFASVSREYARLSLRKAELLGCILSHEFEVDRQFLGE